MRPAAMRWFANAVLPGFNDRLRSLRPRLAVLLWLLSAPLAAQTQALRLAVSNGPVSLPIYVAEAEGYFVREGVEVSLAPCASGRDCVQALKQRQADLATAAELVVALEAPGMPGARDEVDIVIMATLSTSTQHIKLVARREAGIAAAKDLRGKRIASVAGTSAQYFLDSWLVFNDIDPQSVNLVSRPPGELAAALARGEVDAIAIWEPIASLALEALPQGAEVLPSPRVYTQHFNLVVGRSLIAQREGDLVRLLRALERAQRFIAEQPARARQILRTRLGSEVGVDRMAEHVFRLQLDQSLVATMEAQRRWAAHQAGPQAGRAATGLLRRIEPAPLRTAVPGAVALVLEPAR